MHTGDLEAQIGRFLTFAQAAGLSIGVREHLDVRRAVEALVIEDEVPKTARADLRERLAALLARSAAELDVARRAFDQAFDDSKEDSSRLPSTADPPDVIRGEPQPSRSKWRRGHRAALLLSLAALPAERPAVVSDSGPIIGPPPPPIGREEEGGSWEVIRESTVVQALGSAPRPLESADALGLMLTFVLALLGFHLWRLPGRQRALGQARRQHAQAEYHKLSAEAAARGEPLTFSYRVPVHVPLAPGVLDDVATLLARTHQVQSGHELDVDCTIAATIEQGGRFVPVLAASPVPSELLVLVDTEEGHHPWLAGMERTLDALADRGLRLRRYHFSYHPHHLRCPASGERVSLAQLAPRHGKAGLLLLSRKLQPWVLDRHQHSVLAPWVMRLGCFARSAWLDPDPRPVPAGSLRERELRELRNRGLVRFPFTADGWEAVARWFSSSAATLAASAPPVPWPTLPTLGEVEPAVRAWALAAAMVPEATWEQLEAVRRDVNRFPEVGTRLSEWHHLQCLLSWVEQQPGTGDVVDSGPALQLPSELEQALLVTEASLSASGKPPLCLRARALWRQQLREAGEPKGELARWRWRLKCRVHELHLRECEPEAADAEFAASPIAAQAAPVLVQELRQLAAGQGEQAVAAARALKAQQTRAGEGDVARAEIFRLKGAVRGDRRLFQNGVAALGLTLACLAILVANHGAKLGGAWGETPVEFMLALPEVLALRQAEGSSRCPAPEETPGWARRSGEDAYGCWASFSLGDVQVKLRRIPAGTFVMGSPENEEGRYDDEGPQHSVRLSAPYWLAETETTQALWQAVMGQNPSAFEGAARPVEGVSWNDVQTFLKKLDRAMPGLAARLPTEAEWEYACRAGTTTARYGGLDAVAWHRDNSGKETHPTAAKQPNAWGLYDMLGNVWEWCADYGIARYDSHSVTDPQGPSESSARVVRGGSWFNSPRNVRAGMRDGLRPDNRDNSLGFRLARGTGAPESAEP